jgi:hypothetical protein
MLYIHSNVIFSSKIINFIQLLEYFCVDFDFFIHLFMCFGSYNLVLPHYSWCNLAVTMFGENWRLGYCEPVPLEK